MSREEHKLWQNTESKTVAVKIQFRRPNPDSKSTQCLKLRIHSYAMCIILYFICLGLCLETPHLSQPQQAQLRPQAPRAGTARWMLCARVVQIWKGEKAQHWTRVTPPTQNTLSGTQKSASTNWSWDERAQKGLKQKSKSCSKTKGSFLQEDGSLY